MMNDTFDRYVKQPEDPKQQPVVCHCVYGRSQLVVVCLIKLIVDLYVERPDDPKQQASLCHSCTVTHF